jgi:hypothetical protein
MAYIPGPPPSTPDHLADYLRTELSRIAESFAVLQPGYVRYQRVESEPPRSREGDTGFFPAEAGTFDPGSGRGLYWFDGNEYRRLNDADGLGGMFTVGGTLQTLTTTFQKINFLSQTPIAPYAPRGCTVDLINDQITMDRAGLWRFDVAFDLNVPFAEVLEVAMFVNGLEVGQSVIQNTNQVQWIYVSLFGTRNFANGDVVDIRARVQSGTGDVTANRIVFLLTQMLQPLVVGGLQASPPG